MQIEKLKEEFEDVKKKYDWTKEKERGQFIVPKSDLKFFVDALDYLLDQQIIKPIKKAKEKEPTE